MVPGNSETVGDETTTEPVRNIKVEESTDLLSSIRKHGFILGILLMVWLVGYLGFSVLWLLLIVVVSVWRDRASRRKARSTALARAAVENERDSIVGVVRDLPSWVCFLYF